MRYGAYAPSADGSLICEPWALIAQTVNTAISNKLKRIEYEKKRNHNGQQAANWRSFLLFE